MTHLTLTGYEAGRVICGAPKTSDNQYLHAMYAPQSLIDSAECCEECRKLWNDTEEESQ